MQFKPLAAGIVEGFDIRFVSENTSVKPEGKLPTTWAEVKSD